MCIAIHSAGHLTIKLLIEQIWPILIDGSVQFLQCYDIVFRSHSDQPLDRLYVLSPQSEAFSLKKEVKHCDWPYECEQVSTAAEDRFILQVPGLTHLKLETTKLNPVVETPNWLKVPNEATAAFTLTNMTMAKLKFHRKLERYSAARSGETTYWLRLAYIPKFTHRIQNAISFGKDLKVRPYEILSPNEVLRALNNQLNTLATHATKGRTATEAAKKQIFSERYYSPGTSTRIEDHRISLVMDPKFMVTNVLAEGACGFLGVQEPSSKKGHLVRSWFYGAKYYPANDPVTLAQMVYKYMVNWAANEVDGKTKEAISSAVAPEHHRNVSHVVEGLRKLGLVAEVNSRPGYYYLGRESDSDEIGQLRSLFLAEPYEGEEIDFGARDKRVRDCLYGTMEVPNRSGEQSRFEPRGLRLHFDLLYHAGNT
jgi:hypothetical protein